MARLLSGAMTSGEGRVTDTRYTADGGWGGGL